MAWYSWKPYVPVAKRRQQARQKMQALRRKGVNIQPVEIDGRTIAKTFWGKAWCDHLESFRDYDNRLPRGRTYVRNGSVCHLAITKGKIDAKVSGSEIYNLKIPIKTLGTAKWKAVKRRCAGQIGSLLELLQGSLSDHVMRVVTDRKHGLFPLPGEISFSCDCPDWAVMCKHVAAVLYGVGARLDETPELLFLLRGVNHEELIDTDAEVAVSAATRSGKSKRLADDELADVFGIDIDAGAPAETATTQPRKKAKKTTRKAAKRAAKTKLVKNTTKRAKKKTPKKAPKKTTKKAAKKAVTGANSTAKKTRAGKRAAKKKAKRPKANRPAGKTAKKK